MSNYKTDESYETAEIMYEGQRVNGVKEGNGICFWSDGTKYEG